MTANQISYARLGEDTRHNKAVETETHRTNTVREANEQASIQETVRSNKAKETETRRSNLAKEAETHRSNTAQESIKTRDLDSQIIQREYQNIKTAAEASKVRGDEMLADLTRAKLVKDIDWYDTVTLNNLITGYVNATGNVLKGIGSAIPG